MLRSRRAEDVMAREFLEMRAKLLELAASLDRLDRGGGLPAHDVRVQRIRAALELLPEGRADRAERLQQIFSRPYDPNWRASFGLEP